MNSPARKPIESTCCKAPEIFRSDYRDGERPVENRSCLKCGHHWWGGKEYTRKEWDALMEEEA